MCLNIAGWVANRADPDQTPRSAASDLGLHCLLKPVCPIKSDKYGLSIQCGLEIMVTISYVLDTRRFALLFIASLLCRIYPNYCNRQPCVRLKPQLSFVILLSLGDRRIHLTTTMRHCIEPFIITLSTSQYDLNNDERDAKTPNCPHRTSSVRQIPQINFLSFFFFFFFLASAAERVPCESVMPGVYTVTNSPSVFTFASL